MPQSDPGSRTSSVLPDARISRRSLLGATALSAAAAAAPPPSPDVVRANDEGVESVLKRQNTDSGSRWRGAIPDATGLHNPGSASGVLERCSASFLHPGSKYHKSPLLFERMKLAADHLDRVQTPDGNVELLTTNFNSPPDTAFVTLNVGTAAFLAKKEDSRELFGLMEGFLRKGGQAMANGGIHTPNHRWVVCAALAQINEILPDPALVRRIDAWLAEGIDIDADGQYSERSTTVYNAHVDRVLTIVAHKLDRPELLKPVRKNLNAMLHLMHSDYEVVTEVSRRQDRNTRGDMGRYWFALRYLAIKDGNGLYATLAHHFDRRHGRLSAYMEYPELNQPLPALKPPPDNYEKEFPATGIVRIRRGPTSATMILGGSSRFFSVRRGDAVVNAVRFAAAFFGKGQFVPDEAEKRNGVYHFRQSIDSGYYQPFDPPKPVGWGVDNWYKVREGRRRTEVCHIHYAAEVKEGKNGFSVRMKADGTDYVPLSVEVNLRAGGRLAGVAPALAVPDAYMLPSGHAYYELGGDAIRFGPGLKANDYIMVRGAQAKLSGPSVYLTGYTPFDHTLEFEWA